MSIPELLGMAEVAEVAGVKAHTAHGWRKRHDDFPLPVACLRMGDVYARDEILTYLADHGYVPTSKTTVGAYREDYR